MRKTINKFKQHDPRINYRGEVPSRLDNLTDAVFGIAITLLIFNLSNPNSFTDLLDFAKTLPAFLLSISFLLLIWHEHSRFSEIYTLNDSMLAVLNTVFLALVIFFVYPLRFLNLVLTNIYFQTNIAIDIHDHQMPYLMIYYSFAVFALYFTVFLFYTRALKISGRLKLNSFEIFYARGQKERLAVLFFVPLISILAVFWIQRYSHLAASFAGGMAYWLYTPAIIIWHRRFDKKSEAYL
jgi:uncharacterized membrane protein